MSTEQAKEPAMPESLKQPELEVVAYIEHHKGGDNLEWEHPGGKHTPLTSLPAALSLIESLRSELAMMTMYRDRASSELQKAESQLQEAERDARRYEWIRLRIFAGRDIGGRVDFEFPMLPGGAHLLKGSVAQHFDAAIDAALAASSQGGGNG